MKELWNAVAYKPLHNALIGLVAFIPGHSVALAIIILTIAVKSALLPLTSKSSRAQKAMKALEPEMKAIKEQYKDKKEEQARAAMELYQKHGVNPFSGCLPILVQLPFIIALYYVFWKGLSLDPAQLYSFTPLPETLNFSFLGIDISQKSIVLALCAGLTQFTQAQLTMPDPFSKKEEEKKEPTFQDDLQRSMQLQMKYILPVMIGFFAYSISAAVALYWTVGNMVTISQEIYLKRKYKSVSSK